MGRDIAVAEDGCEYLIAKLAQQIATAARDDRLVLSAFARSTEHLAYVHEALSGIVSQVNSLKGLSLDCHYINLAGYYGEPCARHSLPPNMPQDHTYILFTDNFHDTRLISHAHNLIAKTGIGHQFIEFASLLFPFDEPLIIETCGIRHRTRTLEKMMSIAEPKYVGIKAAGMGPDALDLRLFYGDRGLILATDR
jgi:hypothetical protein